MSRSWKSLEDNVRQLAGAIWQGECTPARIGGVDIDGFIQAAKDIRILIEVTERADLAKVREDIIKLRTAKDALYRESGCHSRCYCVLKGNVTKAMNEAASPHQIEVLAFDNFRKIFFDFEAYKLAREAAAFGSAVNPRTGVKDDSTYVPVTYLSNDGSRQYRLSEIMGLLRANKRVVLLGEYGTGKSRCIREIFRSMAAQASKDQNYPLAIDLREAWGVRRGKELVRRHLEDIAIEDLQKPALRALQFGSLSFLFDGFDELGSQAWSDNSDKLRAIRAKSLEGVKDLISQTNGGVLISGREHYFNNNE
jgi:hypothetical protein